MENDLGSLKDEFPDKYLFAEDLGNKKVTLTIGAMNADSLVTPKGKKRAVIVTFVGKKKLLVLNKTNACLINAIFPLAPGASLKSWIGKRITLYPTKCSLGGETVDCIRVYGSPDLPADKEVTVQQGLKKVSMKLFAVNNSNTEATKPVASTQTVMEPDQAILERWDVLGWTREEGRADWTRTGGSPETYSRHLSALIDQANAQEAS